jgi:hypothetical protein
VGNGIFAFSSPYVNEGVVGDEDTVTERGERLVANRERSRSGAGEGAQLRMLRREVDPAGEQKEG